MAYVQAGAVPSTGADALNRCLPASLPHSHGRVGGKPALGGEGAASASFEIPEAPSDLEVKKGTNRNC